MVYLALYSKGLVKGRHCHLTTPKAGHLKHRIIFSYVVQKNDYYHFVYPHIGAARMVVVVEMAQVGHYLYNSKTTQEILKHHNVNILH